MDTDDTIEELRSMADEFIADLTNRYLPFFFLFMVILVIILVLTSCCGFYLAIWLHRSCHCKRFRCCFRIECDREDKQRKRKQYQSKKQWNYFKGGNETCV